jgi:DNA-binding transcriptional LysR family regulator
MIDIDINQLRRLDLTLLLVFEETMATGTLSAAARKLNLTQSAVSHSLKRLREIFDDQLFVRLPHGVTPTPRAQALRPAVLEVLKLLSGAIRPTTFNPDMDDRIFRIAAPDYEVALFAPLMAPTDISSRRPRHIFRNLIRRQAIEALQAGEIDLALGYPLDGYPGCDCLTLYQENYTVVARVGHPALAGKLTIKHYTAYGHVLVSPNGTLDGIVDVALAEQGTKRHVAMAVPYFLSALAAVAHSDLLATVPTRLAVVHADSFGLIQAPPPIAIRSFPVQAIWSRRVSADPASQWLRNQIKAAVAQLDRMQQAASKKLV